PTNRLWHTIERRALQWLRVMWMMKPPRATASMPFASARFAHGRAFPPQDREGACIGGLVHLVRPRHGVPEQAVERVGADEGMEQRDRGDGPGHEERPSVPEEQDEARVELVVGLGERAGTGQHRARDGDEEEKHREGARDRLPDEAARPPERFA